MDDFEDDDFFEESFSERSAAKIVTVPLGHCLVNERWKNSGISKIISKSVTVKYSDGLGPIDFQPAAGCVVLYLAEGDAICDPQVTLKPKLDKLKRIANDRKAQVTLRVLVVFLKTSLSSQYMLDAQSLVLLEYENASFVPVTSPEQLGQLVQQLGRADNKRSNPFNSFKKEAPSEVQRDILLAVCQIPGVGEVKARKLLGNFGGIRKIGRARQQDLKSTLGNNLARGVEDFFNKKNTI